MRRLNIYQACAIPLLAVFFTVSIQACGGDASQDEPKTESAETLIVKAKHSWKTGDMKGAIDTLQKARESDPDNAVVTYLLGSLLMVTGKQEEGQKLITRAVELDPDIHEKVEQFDIASGQDQGSGAPPAAASGSPQQPGEMPEGAPPMNVSGQQMQPPTPTPEAAGSSEQ